jgi:hypothetical protein
MWKRLSEIYCSNFQIYLKYTAVLIKAGPHNLLIFSSKNISIKKKTLNLEK